AHQEAVEGVFHDRTLHERDQQAKWGDTQPPAPAPPVNALPRKGLISTQGWQVVRVSSESTFNGRVATAAFDGDPLTWWHTRFEGGAVGPPHELVIDLGRLYTIRGFCYLARQDESWNGTVKDCEFYVASESPQQFETKAVSTTLRKTKEAQVVSCEPLRGRYVLFRALSEVNGGPWASMAEFGVIGEP
ncbi:MAG: discoidin domain-containing protein, partial [Candidatus Zipacnadales bacterium]